ncbi:hypothetical protein M758_7G094700, partial [Ceratodon purpureus]
KISAQWPQRCSADDFNKVHSPATTSCLCPTPLQRRPWRSSSSTVLCLRTYTSSVQAPGAAPLPTPPLQQQPRYTTTPTPTMAPKQKKLPLRLRKYSDNYDQRENATITNADKALAAAGGSHGSSSGKNTQ